MPKRGPLTAAEKRELRRKRRIASVERRAEAIAYTELLHMKQIARERFCKPTLKRNPKGVRCAPERPRQALPSQYFGHTETNARYPLYEILNAKLQRRKLRPQTKAAHW